MIPHNPFSAKLEQRTFLLLLLLVTGLFLYLLRPFFAPLFWACAIGMLFYPLQQRLTRLWGERPNSTALATLAICVVVVVIPVLALLTSFVQEGANLYQRIDRGEVNPGAYIDRVRNALPQLQLLLDRVGLDAESLKAQAANAAVVVSRFVAKNALSLGQSTFQLFLHLCLTLYLAFFLLRDGPRLVDLLVHSLRLGDERERLLLSKFTEVTRATVKGNLVVAVVQGALGGLIFWILGMPAALLWGVAMAVLSLIPAVGAGLIWAPAAIYLFATGSVVSAVVLLLYGVLVIGLADNILRPILVGRDTELPDWLVLLSTLGGLVVFGISGFVVGPLIAALFIAFWQIFARDFNGLGPLDDAPEGQPDPPAPAPGAGE